MARLQSTEKGTKGARDRRGKEGGESRTGLHASGSARVPSVREEQRNKAHMSRGRIYHPQPWRYGR